MIATQYNSNLIKQYIHNTDIFPVKSKSAVILGCGPSLTRFLIQIKQLYEEGAIIFAVNHIWKLALDFPIHYYLALDRHTWKEYNEIHKLKALRHFVPNRYRKYVLIDRVITFEYASSQNAHNEQKRASAFNFAEKLEDGLGHGHTSIYPCMQLAYIQGAKKIHLFGVDYEIDTNGKTHFYGVMRRTKRSWDFGKKAIITGLKILKKRGIECLIHSDLFEESNAFD